MTIISATGHAEGKPQGPNIMIVSDIQFAELADAVRYTKLQSLSEWTADPQAVISIMADLKRQELDNLAAAAAAVKSTVDATPVAISGSQIASKLAAIEAAKPKNDKTT